ncbi:MAG: replication and repair protein RecR [Patescibacteria group bacterium]|nr:replication and repair protein RecR [Patescibacteria group bacterium]
MKIVPSSVERLIEELGKLPGIGPRTAERLAFHMLKSDPVRATTLGAAIDGLHAGVHACRTCFNFAEAEECEVCGSLTRHRTTIAVVEEPFDVVAIEKTGLYQGLYHVLGGVISPMDGVGPDRLEIASLVQRAQNGEVEEIILATNPSLEGESTAMYIRGQLEPTGIKLTRLARGLPVGGDLEYADQITLGRALQGRQSF